MTKGNDSGSRRIVSERKRQRIVEGWTLHHDAAEHTPEQLEKAAACYLLYPEMAHEKVHDSLSEPTCNDGTDTPTKLVPLMWPFNASSWKPGPTRVRDLEKAGALTAAAIDLRLYFEEEAKKANNP